jgi:hypothetical protein
MEYKFPEMDLSNDKKLWLQELFNNWEKNIPFDSRVILNKFSCTDCRYRIKFVRSGSSRSGNAIPALMPASLHFKNQAIFFASVRMV